ncbi:copper amine oxidase N-terminal domain-containing protein [Siminovitchia terrae]|nr:copper amine oxidase N-terminal domain-containing protein [Siminovitchia terrae]
MKKLLIMMMSVFFLLNIVHFTVKADDDHDHKKYKYYKGDWGDDDDDDDDYDDDYDEDNEHYNNERTDNSKSITSQWYLWTRMAGTAKGELPFSEPQNMTFQNNSSKKQLSLYCIPMNGELFIPGKSVGEFLGAKASFYSASRILELNMNDTELIFRVDTNVSYENKIKTPIPARAMFFNEDVYLPISVVANGLGFSIKWDTEQQVIYFQEMNN